MTTLYINCFLVSLIGLGISILTILRNLTSKAKLANVIFDWKLYWKSDLLFQLSGTLLTVGLFLLFLNPLLIEYPQFATKTVYIMLIFATTGYMGSDIASRLFSVVNSRINGAIDYKTTAADAASGNLANPTPAMPPQPPTPKNVS